MKKIALLSGFVVFNSISAQSSPAPTVQLASNIIGLNFADLTKISVTSVSKKEDKLMETAAAVYVITAEEIRRSGVTNVPEALRLAPGLDVARTGPSSWAISSRGFNGSTANKLLVLIDGRSVYSPLYGGVFWDVQNVPLDTIDRIEVIRGPGAAVWGANAVNGVINIIRKPASETQGGRIVAGGGTEERSFGEARYGGKLGESGHYRVDSDYFQTGDFRTVNGDNGQDQRHMGSAGFRGDWKGSERDTFMFSTDGYAGEEAGVNPINTLEPPYRTVEHSDTEVNGTNALGQWTRTLSNTSSLQVQTYYDQTRRHIPSALTEDRETYDAQLQHQFLLSPRQHVIWGFGYDVSADNVRDSLGVDFNPDSATDQNYDVFFQDELRLCRAVLLTFGSKFEHNNYTGFETEPNIRASWMIDHKNTLWASVSRAIRKPTRFDRDLRISAVDATTPLTIISFRGNKNFDSEKVVAYETGYRSQLTQRVFFDVASFYNVYSDLFSVEPQAPFTETDPSPAHNVNPYFLFENQLRGESYGVEVAPQVQITEWWRMQAQYSYLHERLHLQEGSADTVSTQAAGDNPAHQASLRASFNLPRHFELDGDVRYVDDLPSLHIGSYTVGDARVGWKGIQHLNIEIVGQNLFMTHHLEFAPGNEVERSVFGKVTLDF